MTIICSLNSNMSVGLSVGRINATSFSRTTSYWQCAFSSLHDCTKWIKKDDTIGYKFKSFSLLAMTGSNNSHSVLIQFPIHYLPNNAGVEATRGASIEFGSSVVARWLQICTTDSLRSALTSVKLLYLMANNQLGLFSAKFNFCSSTFQWLPIARSTATFSSRDETLPYHTL